MKKVRTTAQDLLDEFVLANDLPLQQVKILLGQFIKHIMTIHKGVPGEAYPEDPQLYCDVCMARDGGSQKYPCRTIKIVKKYLARSK